jgi:hypothetical protein
MQIVTLLTNLRSQPNEGAGFKDGMNFMTDLYAGLKEKQAQGDESDDMMKSLEQVASVINMMKTVGMQTETPPVQENPPHVG